MNTIRMPGAGIRVTPLRSLAGRTYVPRGGRGARTASTSLGSTGAGSARIGSAKVGSMGIGRRGEEAEGQISAVEATGAGGEDAGGAARDREPPDAVGDGRCRGVYRARRVRHRPDVADEVLHRAATGDGLVDSAVRGCPSGPDRSR